MNDILTREKYRLINSKYKNCIIFYGDNPKNLCLKCRTDWGLDGSDGVKKLETAYFIYKMYYAN